MASESQPARAADSSRSSRPAASARRTGLRVCVLRQLQVSAALSTSNVPSRARDVILTSTNGPEFGSRQHGSWQRSHRASPYMRGSVSVCVDLRVRVCGHKHSMSGLWEGRSLRLCACVTWRGPVCGFRAVEDKRGGGQRDHCTRLPTQALLSADITAALNTAARPRSLGPSLPLRGDMAPVAPRTALHVGLAFVSSLGTALGTRG